MGWWRQGPGLRSSFSGKPEVLTPAAEYGADFILHRGNETAKTEIANVVNSRAAWRVGLLGEGTTVTGLPGAVTPVPLRFGAQGSVGPASSPARRRRRRLYQGAQRAASPTISKRHEPGRGPAGLAATPPPSLFEGVIKSPMFPYLSVTTSRRPGPQNRRTRAAAPTPLKATATDRP